MRKFTFILFFVAMIVGLIAGRAQAQCNQIVFSEVVDHWAATRHEESAGKWRVGIVGKMKPEENFAKYFIPPEPMEQKLSDFYSILYANQEKIVESDLMCIGGKAKSTGQWFVCRTQRDIPKLPENAEVSILWRGSDMAGGNCGIYGPIAIKLDANNNFIPDDHPSDNQLPKPPEAQEPVADADGDGVADSADECDDTPGGTEVDSSGCPVQVSSKADADVAPGTPEMPAGFMDEGSCSLMPAATANPMLLTIAAALAFLIARRRR